MTEQSVMFFQDGPLRGTSMGATSVPRVWKVPVIKPDAARFGNMSDAPNEPIEIEHVIYRRAGYRADTKMAIYIVESAPKWWNDIAND